MGRHVLVVVGLASVTACSWHMGKPTPRAGAKLDRVCERRGPLVDTIAGASLIGLGAGAGLLSEGDPGLALASAVALAAVGVVFFVSAKHGFDEQAACYDEALVAARTNTTPLHMSVERSGRTCVQRRLDMYSQAVTGADPVQRAQLLAELPVCEESPARERAWLLTKNAALDAGNGKCDEIESIAQHIHAIDVGLHDVVLLGDVHIKYCLQRREL